MVGVCCGAALDSPNHSCVLSTSLAFEDLRNGNFGDVNDGKCKLFIRTTISGGTVSSVANVMEFIATKSRAGQERFANLLFYSFTVIWVKNCRSKKGIK